MSFMRDRVVGCIEDSLGTTRIDLSDDRTIRGDLGLDDLETWGLIWELEDEFKIYLSDDECPLNPDNLLVTDMTIAELVELVTKMGGA